VAFWKISLASLWPLMRLPKNTVCEGQLRRRCGMPNHRVGPPSDGNLPGTSRGARRQGIRATLAQLVRKLLPDRWLHTLRRPAVLPRYYREFFWQAEIARDAAAAGRNRDDEYWAGVLRRFGHILDKGLQRCDCESGHGDQARRAALEAKASITTPAWKADPSVAWAEERIRRHESVQRDGPTGRLDHDVPRVGQYDALLEVIRGRRSTRWYREQAVSPEVVRKVTEVAAWAPNSCNRQAIKVFATNDPHVARAAAQNCRGCTCFSKHIPCFLAFAADVRLYGARQDLWLPLLDVPLGIQNCCLVAHALGLSLTLLNWCRHTRQEDRQLRDLLRIPDHYLIVLVGVLGYPEAWPEPPRRKSPEHTCCLRVPEV